MAEVAHFAFERKEELDTEKLLAEVELSCN
jgi:hypothetical protein